MKNFTYHRPGSVEEAAKTLSAASDGTLMAGGMTLVPTLKQRLASPSDVVDLGGVAHGIGQAMLENCVYDPDSGQLVTGSFMDYCMPRADDLPNFNLGFTETPCPHNPLGVKGCGEAGAIAAPPALINAITDAIGVDIDMPATPEKVWRALQSRQQAAE